ncbi:hypothetical protein CCO03_16475 [Comamonas serinivorans]|uniref:Cell envelope biogenesis protein TolA n=1 Tax=Comamonas serinivorans TaxID=1082851 RepID=A0A1Y0ERB9_9BURK|nr:hypothetical protein [Comamonas serinivorans]ARU06048.1 hypothetical protein CCO03_16475 [Comamonas serinivorans]
MHSPKITLALLSALFTVGAVQAQGMTSDQHAAAKKQIEANHKSDKAQCDTLNANAKDVCEAEAEARERTAKAELEQQYKPSAKHRRELDEARAKGTYEVAKEKCDDHSGATKRACEKQAEADHERAKADIKATSY